MSFRRKEVTVDPAIVAQYAKYKASEGFFMRDSKMPSIMCFSLTLLFYGNKNEIRQLLFQLKKSGQAFYKKKVIKGNFFRSNLVNSHQFHFNSDTIGLLKELARMQAK